MMPDYSLYYWPIPFRGHFIRYVLAATGATWDEPGFDEIARLKALAPADQPTPFMGPPILLDRDTGAYLSQMPAIMMHLGRRYRLIGDQDRALRLLCDACDVLQEITRNHGAQMWDRDSWVTFADTRLPRWMQMHERHVATGLVAGATFLSGKDQPGLEDLTLAALAYDDRLPARALPASGRQCSAPCGAGHPGCRARPHCTDAARLVRARLLRRTDRNLDPRDAERRMTDEHF